MRKILPLLLAFFAAWAAPLSATPIASSSDARCSVGLHCVFTITKTGAATSYSDLVGVTSGAAAGVSQRIKLRLLRGETSGTIAVQGVAPGQFTLTLLAARYAKIGRSPGIGTVDPLPPPVPPPAPPPPPPPTQTCPDGTVILATSACPIPPPPPPPVANTGSIPSPSLSGLPATTAADFVISAAIQAMSATPNHTCGDGTVLPNNQPCSAAPDNVGAFRFICMAGQVKADDPIVYPGQPGASHLHQFYGNEAVDAFTDYTSLRAKGTSTCMRGVASPANRSAYWMPAMLDGAGNVVKPAYVAIYYKRRPATDPKCGGLGTAWAAEGQCVPIPNGLRFIFGYDMLTGKAPTGSLWFNCQSPDARNPVPGVVPGHYANLTQALANCPIGALVGSVIEAPSCWNGSQLDSPNHRDHIGYKIYDAGATGQPMCDAAHKYVIPTFTLGAWYPVAAGMHFSSDAMVPNAEPGTTFHADYFEGWDPTVKAMWHDNCINKMLNCSGGNLGNGFELVGAAI